MTPAQGVGQGGQGVMVPQVIFVSILISVIVTIATYMLLLLTFTRSLVCVF